MGASTVSMKLDAFGRNVTLQGSNVMVGVRVGVSDAELDVDVVVVMDRESAFV